ncbi:MAG TPA: GGDEF domain-containing protein [Steroidobacteraceae bacterium]
MSEAAEWKQKYRDSLLEMEAEEKRWRDIEYALRRLVGRLCAAGMGVNPQLDDELTAVAAANRRNADVLELEKLAASLTTTVVAVDAVAPVVSVQAAPLRWHATCGAVAAFLEQLRADGTDESRVQALLSELLAAAGDAALAAVVSGTADLVRARSAALAAERARAAQVLSEVTKRLEEVAGYLTESNSASRARFDDAQSLNDTVLSHVRELNEEVSGATELGRLQSIVRSRLEAVAKQVCDFRARETDRLLESNGRADRMRARIADLERETQELHSKLDLEKHGARLDPLTGVANRKSYDERFAQDIARRDAGGAPLALLLWDIDNFKLINDNYGHRAGDRVLQSVAACFKAALRSSDFVARIGGEEFAVLLNGLKLAEAVNVANQLRTAVEGLRFHFRGTPVRVTVSCGVSQLNPGDSPEASYERADQALYRAKGGGKNLCVAA